jgi:signal transduction histidine kinase/response regulator RpfG family c-di-GMP phosphodiesterase
MTFFKKLGNIGSVASDGSNITLQKNFLVYLGVAMSMGGILWGSICFVMGLYLQAAIPFGYLIITVFNLYYFYRTKNFAATRFIQTLISLLLPFLFQFTLGGFLPSGGVMLWSILALIASLNIAEARDTLKWLAIFIMLTVLSGLLDGKAIQAFEFNKQLSLLFFTINFSIICSIVFGLCYFLASTKNSLIEELNASMNQAEVANKAKSEFLANMSHEIRTPLNAVLGFSELLTKSKLDDTQQQYLKLIGQSGQLLLDIINDVLDFSKIEAGKLDVKLEQVDTYEICSEVVDLIKIQAFNKKLELLLNISPQVPQFIWADQIRLRQILVNLLNNAVKFTLEGEVELRVEVIEKINEESSTLRFSVIDTGIGISEEQEKNIFKAFTQADSSTTKRFGGTGLGLTICNKLLELFNSSLKLTTAVGKGSTFYFEIDVKASSNGIIEITKLENIKKVLVVDDNENNRLILNDALKLQGLETVLVNSGNKALEVLSTYNDIDLAILDYNMPYMNGIETIEKIKQTFDAKQYPFLLLYTSSAIEDVLEDCKRLDIRHRLSKPAKLKQLLSTIADIDSGKEVLSGAASEMFLKNNNKLLERSFKVILAEDNPVNMLLCKSLLKKLLPNVEIYACENGSKAIEIFKTNRPDLVLMDIQMPELNGYDATLQIRQLENGTEIPIIALTAGTIQGDKEKAITAGMNDYLAKPINITEFNKVVTKWVSKVQMPA